MAFKHFALYGDYKPGLFINTEFAWSTGEMTDPWKAFPIWDLGDFSIYLMKNEMIQYNKFKFIQVNINASFSEEAGKETAERKVIKALGSAFLITPNPLKHLTNVN